MVLMVRKTSITKSSEDKLQHRPKLKLKFFSFVFMLLCYMLCFCSVPWLKEDPYRVETSPPIGTWHFVQYFESIDFIDFVISNASVTFNKLLINNQAYTRVLGYFGGEVWTLVLYGGC